jgi:hypothetical protein
MRFSQGLLVSLVVAGLVGCSGGSSAPTAPSAPSAPAAPSAVPVPKITTRAPSVPSAAAGTKASARAAAEQFYGLYATSHYAALWNLLAPATKSQVSMKAWIAVHQACSTAGAGKSRTIKTVTVFGNAAIVAETVVGVAADTSEDVFNYIDGSWRYSPQAPGVYRHSSVTADIAAAKAARLCTTSRVF